MQKNTIIVGLIALVLGAGLGYALAPKSIQTSQPTGTHVMPNGETMSHGGTMQSSMESMMAELNGKTGDEFDKAFLSEMIMHHQGAVEMAEAALQNANHQEIKDMARAIISAQTSEIKQMENWLQTWYGQ